MGSPSYHILDIPHTICSHSMSPYLHPFKKHTARQYITILAKREPASPRSSSLVSIHRQSDKRTPKRTIKQPSEQPAYILSIPMLFYSHFFESWDKTERWKTCLASSGKYRHSFEVLGLEYTAELPPTTPSVECCNSHPL